MERLPSNCSFKNLKRHSLITSLRYSPAVVLSTKNFRAFFLLVSHSGIKLWRKVNVWSWLRNTRNVERASITSCSSRLDFSLWRMNKINGTGSGEGATLAHPQSFLYKSSPILATILLKFCRKKLSTSPGNSSSSGIILPECAWFWRALPM